jgi:hypothetical protein
LLGPPALQLSCGDKATQAGMHGVFNRLGGKLANNPGMIVVLAIVVSSLVVGPPTPPRHRHHRASSPPHTLNHHRHRHHRYHDHDHHCGETDSVPKNASSGKKEEGTGGRSARCPLLLNSRTPSFPNFRFFSSGPIMLGRLCPETRLPRRPPIMLGRLCPETGLPRRPPLCEWWAQSHHASAREEEEEEEEEKEGRVSIKSTPPGKP